MAATDLNQDIAVLDDMLALLDSPDRWTRGNFVILSEDDTPTEFVNYEPGQIGAMCLLGAEAVAARHVVGSRYRAVDTILQEVYDRPFARALRAAVDGEHNDDIVEYNDHSERTYGEIIDVIQRARASLIEQSEEAVHEEA